MSKLRPILLATSLVLALSGCSVKTVSSPRGCEKRVAAVKVQPCKRCVERGPRWHYKPLHPPGARCVKR